MLLFIVTYFSVITSVSNVSIHLMLLFIWEAFLTVRKKGTFQYISCYCLSSSHAMMEQTSLQFQYISCYCLSISGAVNSATFTVSIHLMLLFIMMQQQVPQQMQSFNTSHVTVYLRQISVTASRTCVSIHLMLLFISFVPPTFPCSSPVSIHLMLLFIKSEVGTLLCSPRFNTSHVTVYLFTVSRIVFAIFCFNTSHVTVYLERKLHFSCRIHCFNTSHVTVYPGKRTWMERRTVVSIHLMLLFIICIDSYLPLWNLFQYISCYCLSSLLLP